MTPAPAPCCLLDPSKNIVHELDRSGGRCLDLRPLDQEIWEYLCLDCCWVLELQVSRAELEVPLGDSPGRSGVIEDVCEWCAAHDCEWEQTHQNSYHMNHSYHDALAKIYSL